MNCCATKFKGSAERLSVLFVFCFRRSFACSGSGGAVKARTNCHRLCPHLRARRRGTRPQRLEAVGFKRRRAVLDPSRCSDEPDVHGALPKARFSRPQSDRLQHLSSRGVRGRRTSGDTSGRTGIDGEDNRRSQRGRLAHHYQGVERTPFDGTGCLRL